MAETTTTTTKPAKADSKKPATEAAPAPAGATEGAAAAAPKGRKKLKKHIPAGVAHILATFNNTIITITDLQGNVVAWSSAGERNFKGSRKGTPFAAQVAAEEVCRQVRDVGMRSVSVIVKGPGAGRESALRALGQSGMKVSVIRDETPIPHNGCRPPKRRRV